MKVFDDSFRNTKIKLIAGIDEAGRGPLAGPVVTAAVVFNPDTIIDGVKDSKKLSAKKREELYDIIIDSALSYHIEIVDNNVIDEINILNATLLGMKLSSEKLSHKPDLVLVDGNKVFESEFKVNSIVKGDSKSFSIAAASILAKVTRDRLMIEYSEKYPYYFWEKNKGYPTKAHIEAIRKNGITPLHRSTFMKKILNGEQYELYK